MVRYHLINFLSQMNLFKSFSEKSTLALGAAALVAAPLLTGCANKTVYHPYPNIQGQFPNSPNEVIYQTTQAAEGIVQCVQTPPDITVSTAAAAQSCLMGGDLPAEAACGGYQFQAVCHNPTFNNGIACLGVNSVTCDGVTIIGQRGPIQVASGRVPVRVMVPAPNPGNPTTPGSLPQLGDISIPGLPQSLPCFPGNIKFPLSASNN